MILVMRVNGSLQTYSPKDTDEAVKRLVECNKSGCRVDYWVIMPEGKGWGDRPE